MSTNTGKSGAAATQGQKKRAQEPKPDTPRKAVKTGLADMEEDAVAPLPTYVNAGEWRLAHSHLDDHVFGIIFENPECNFLALALRPGHFRDPLLIQTVEAKFPPTALPARSHCGAVTAWYFDDPLEFAKIPPKTFIHQTVDSAYLCGPAAMFFPGHITMHRLLSSHMWSVTLPAATLVDLQTIVNECVALGATYAQLTCTKSRRAASPTNDWYLRLDYPQAIMTEADYEWLEGPNWDLPVSGDRTVSFTHHKICGFCGRSSVKDGKHPITECYALRDVNSLRLAAHLSPVTVGVDNKVTWNDEPIHMAVQPALYDLQAQITDLRKELDDLKSHKSSSSGKSPAVPAPAAPIVPGVKTNDKKTARRPAGDKSKKRNAKASGSNIVDVAK